MELSFLPVQMGIADMGTNHTSAPTCTLASTSLVHAPSHIQTHRIYMTHRRCHVHAAHLYTHVLLCALTHMGTSTLACTVFVAVI